MTRKILVLLLIVLMIVVGTVGCRPEEAPPAPTETPEETPPAEETPEAREMDYEDGNYRGELEVNEKGWTSFVEFVVEDGRIVQVDYDEVDEEGNLKSEDEEYNQQWEAVAGTNADEAYPTLEEQLIEVQDIEAIDAVTGATATTRDFKDAVALALEEGPREEMNGAEEPEAEPEEVE